jgi:hypothetical protein
MSSRATPTPALTVVRGRPPVVGCRLVTRPIHPDRAPGPLELYPAFLAAVRILLANRKARRELARASALAEHGRSTGVRV